MARNVKALACNAMGPGMRSFNFEIKKMKNVEKVIVIQAPVTRVWEVLMDFDSYNRWNPFVKTIAGNSEVGEQLQITIAPPGKGEMKLKPRVLTVTTGKEFRWEGHLFVKGLFDGEHYFKLERISENETRFIHGEHFRGLLREPILSMVGAATEKGFEMMNEAIKQEAERHPNLKAS